MKRITLSALVLGVMLLTISGLVGSVESGIGDVNLLSPSEGDAYNGNSILVAWEWIGDVGDVTEGELKYSSVGCDGPWHFLYGPFGTADPTTYDWDISNLNEGNTYCLLIKTDVLGIEDKSGLFSIDRTDPTAYIRVDQRGIENDVPEPDTITIVYIEAEDNLELAYCKIDWDDGSPLEDCLANPIATYEHQYADNDDYGIVLTVEDKAGNWAEASAVAEVENVVPWDVAITTTQEVAAVGEAVKFEGTGTDVEADMEAGLICTWIFDGTDEIEVIADENGYCFTYYTWEEASIHTVDLTVSDKDTGSINAEQYLIEIVQPVELLDQEVGAFYPLEADFGQSYGNEFEHGIENGHCEKIIAPGNLVIGDVNGRCYVEWEFPRPTNNEQGEHFVIIKVSNEGENGEEYEYYSFYITVYSWIIPLQEGWNLISIPLVHETGLIEDVILNPLYDCLPGGTEYAVWSYQFDGEESDWISSRRSGYGDLDAVEPGHAYWVRIEEDVGCEDVYLKGFGKKTSPPPSGLPPAIDVPYNNWMFIGRYGIVGPTQGEAGDLHKRTALKSLDQYNIKLKRVLEYTGIGFEDTSFLSPEHGYWAYIVDEFHDTGTYAPVTQHYWWN